MAWTPTVVIMTQRGAEVYRIEGYLPRELFRVELEMGLARVAFMSKRFDEAERMYDHVVNSHPSHAAEALYWRNVCRYNATHDATPLMEVAQELRQRFPDSPWTVRSSVWLPPEETRRQAA